MFQTPSINSKFEKGKNYYMPYQVAVGWNDSANSIAVTSLSASYYMHGWKFEYPDCMTQYQAHPVHDDISSYSVSKTVRSPVMGATYTGTKEFTGEYVMGKDELYSVCTAQITPYGSSPFTISVPNPLPNANS